MNSRARAARAITRVMQGSSLDQALPEVTSGTTPRDQSFIRALCYGVLRDQRLLNHIAAGLLDKPLKGKQAEILQLILVGLFQLRSMRVAPHGAVAETVAACGQLGQPRARGLANAILRRYQREAETIESAIPEEPDLRLSHPRWMTRTLQSDWPDNWETILQANQKPAPMVLRVNTCQTSREAYLSELAGAGIEAEVLPVTSTAIQLVNAVDVQQLPGFSEGLVSVQDGSAQLAATLLDVAQGARVLDACAAPGGKTAHLLESFSDICLVALDKKEERLQRVKENLQRLKLDDASVVIKAADAGDTESWWDGKHFDRILLDAPCSGSGVIRRHPDIKWLRRADDVPRMAAEQLRLLNTLWPTLASGGKLLYATCSVFRAEGEEVVNNFLEQTADARSDSMNVDWGVASGAGRVILPGPMDGFFYCLLSRQ